MIAWLAAFAVTQGVECPIYARALRARSWNWGWAFGLSAVTHPVVFFVFPALFPTQYWTHVSAAEAFAVGMETIGLRALGVPRALGWALLANGSSFAVGLGLRAGLGWP